MVSIPGIGSLASIPGASLLPGATPPPAESTGLKGFLSKGFAAPWWLQFFMVGIAPFLVLIPYIGPAIFTFPYTFGVNGINLLASNSMGWAAAKAGTNMMCQLIHTLLKVYLPGWWTPYLKAILCYGNPWFVFDILQVWNPKFKTEGFKIPFWNKQTNSVLEKGGRRGPSDIGYDISGSISYGLMSPIPIGAMCVLLLPAFYTMAANFPPEISAKITPILDTITTLGGGLTAIAGGGIGTFVLLPQLMSKVQGGLSSIMAGGAAPPVQGGGGIPTIGEVAEQVLKNSPQTGGAYEESSLFIGILAFTALGGMSLALSRRQ